MKQNTHHDCLCPFIGHLNNIFRVDSKSRVCASIGVYISLAR